VFISSESWIRYRIREDSCVSVVTRAGRYDAVRRYFLGWLQTHLAEHRLAEPAVSAALEAALGQGSRDGPAAREPASGSGAGPREQGAATHPVQFGTLRRLTPVSGHWGFDRGVPIDRYYIEQFLAEHVDEIRGHVLEIEDDVYTRRFGGHRVTACDILHLTDENERATIVADLADAQHIPSGTFDCVILTQTLQYIYDTRAVVKTLERILKPEGVLLATLPGITRIGREKWPGSWFWGFTTDSARRLFAEAFDTRSVTIEAFGNVLTASAFLYGLAAEELRQDELNHRDPDFEVLIVVRAVKATDAS
jgi:SAM-dependent methyltransferase